jgi:hypothetical protein
MACPDCGSSFGECRIASSIETHGLDCGPYERFDEEYVMCRECRGMFDIGDWDGGPERLFDEPEPAPVSAMLHVDQVRPGICGPPLATMDDSERGLLSDATHQNKAPVIKHRSGC